MYGNYMKHQPGMLIFLSMLVSLFMTGCISPNPIKPEAMIPKNVKLHDSISSSIQIDVYGGNPGCYDFCIASEAYSEAVKSSLMKAKSFSIATPGSDADYLLDIIIAYRWYMVGMPSDAILTTKWELTKADTARVVWSEVITTKYRTDAMFDANEKVNAGVAKQNVSMAIHKLTSLPMTEDGEIAASNSIAPAAGSQYVNLNDGLAAFYPFSGNANDESAHGYDGKVYGAVLTTDGSGNADSAYSFNGNSSIHIRHDKTLNIQNSFSISLWFKYGQNFTGHQRLIGKGISPDGETFSWSLTIKKDGRIAFFWETDDDTDYEVLTENPVEPFKFNHIVAMFDSVLNANKIYVNGSFNNAMWAIEDIPGQNRDPLIIGIRSTPSKYDRAFNGTIDDVRIYNRALSESEIRELYSGDVSEKLSLRKTDQ